MNKHYYSNTKNKCAIRKTKRKGLIFILKKLFQKGASIALTKGAFIALTIIILAVAIKTQRITISELRTEIESKQSIITEMENSANDKSENLEKTINQLQINNSELNQKVEELNTQINTVTDDKTNLQKELDTAKNEISKYKKQIDNLKNSSKEVTSRSSNSLSEKNTETIEKTDEKINSDDLDLMARIIYAEAGNCSDEEQLLVGNVIMNRVASPKYPNTIREVIYQKGQYSPTWNGAINKKPSEKAIKNAKRILNGERFCPTNVVYQAMFKQGSGVYKVLKNPDGITYFCYE